MIHYQQTALLLKIYKGEVVESSAEFDHNIKCLEDAKLIVTKYVGTMPTWVATDEGVNLAKIIASDISNITLEFALKRMHEQHREIEKIKAELDSGKINKERADMLHASAFSQLDYFSNKYYNLFQLSKYVSGK